MIKNVDGKIVDTSTNMERKEFWEANEQNATITKRTFYKRVKDSVTTDKYATFQEALTDSKGSRKASVDATNTDAIKSVSDINKESDNFFDTFANSTDEDTTSDDSVRESDDDDTMVFGEERVKAPVGA